MKDRHECTPAATLAPTLHRNKSAALIHMQPQSEAMGQHSGHCHIIYTVYTLWHECALNLQASGPQALAKSGTPSAALSFGSCLSLIMYWLGASLCLLWRLRTCVSKSSSAAGVTPGMRWAAARVAGLRITHLPAHID